MKKRQAQKLADALNGVVHSRNLYCRGRRLINAEVHFAKATEDEPAHYFVTLEDLHSGAKTPVSTLTMNDVLLVDGYGREVVL